MHLYCGRKAFRLGFADPHRGGAQPGAVTFIKSEQDREPREFTAARPALRLQRECRVLFARWGEAGKVTTQEGAGFFVQGTREDLLHPETENTGRYPTREGGG